MQNIDKNSDTKSNKRRLVSVKRSKSGPTAASKTTTTIILDVRQADILSGRGKSFAKHFGNLRFDMSTHAEKKRITEEIVDEITSMGRFLHCFDKGLEKWTLMNREASRIKVALALQYRQRRVAKGLESMVNDSIVEPIPLPTSSPQTQTEKVTYQPNPQPASGSPQNQENQPVHSFQPICPIAATVSGPPPSHYQDSNVGLLSQCHAGSQQVQHHQQQQQQQQQQYEWEAIHRLHQLQLQRCVSQPNLPFGYNDTTLNTEQQPVQMDQRTRSHQFLDGQGQQRPIQNLVPTTPTTHTHHEGHQFNNTTNASPIWSDLGHVPMNPHRIHSFAESPEHEFLNTTQGSLPFDVGNCTNGVSVVTEELNRCGTYYKSLAARSYYDTILRQEIRPVQLTYETIQQRGEHRPVDGCYTTPHQQQQSTAFYPPELCIDKDDDNDDSLSDLWIEEVQDDVDLHGNEPVFVWGEPEQPLGTLPESCTGNKKNHTDKPPVCSPCSATRNDNNHNDALCARLLDKNATPTDHRPTRAGSPHTI